jgi:hypothetical protein
MREIEIWRVTMLMVNRYANGPRRIASGMPRSEQRKAITPGRLLRHSRDRAAYRHDWTTELIKL